jgi:uncharacterized membrane protein
MRTPASVRTHPIHLMLIPLPIGLWIFALVADVLAMATNRPHLLHVAYYCIGGGIVGALLAAVPGLVDLMSLDDRDVRRVGLMHMVINLAAVGLFTLNFFMRRSQPDHGGPWWLTLLGVGLISASGWLGGEMVHRYGVSVEAGAGPTRT